MIVDCHAHSSRYPDHFIRDIFISSMPAEQRGRSDEWFKRAWDNPVENYLAQMEGAVDKAILIPTRCPDLRGMDVPNDYVAELVKKYPDKLAGMCSVIPTREGAVAELERAVKELGLIGLKLNPPDQGFDPTDEKIAFPIYEKAQELGIPVVFHAGHSEVRKAQLKFANVLLLDEVAINFPELKIVIAHMGYYHYQDTVALMTKHDNVFADISWLVSVAALDRRAIPWHLPVVEYPYFQLLFPILYYFTQTHGTSDKLIFGSDWPGASPRRAVEVIQNLNSMLKEYNLPQLPRIAIYNILHRNWRQVFKL